MTSNIVRSILLVTKTYPRRKMYVLLFLCSIVGLSEVFSVYSISLIVPQLIGPVSQSNLIGERYLNDALSLINVDMSRIVYIYILISFMIFKPLISLFFVYFLFKSVYSVRVNISCDLFNSEVRKAAFGDDD